MTKYVYYVSIKRLKQHIMIPSDVTIENSKLPDESGVYFFYDDDDTLLYIGKATSLKRRVRSYFQTGSGTSAEGVHNPRIAEMVKQIARIEYITTPTAIEALVLEANQIKAKQPKFNIRERDDKSFLYLAITNERYPRPLLMRGHELQEYGINPFDRELPESAKDDFLRVFGPYTSSRSLRNALDLVRKFIPWSDCEPPEETGREKPCFNAQIGKCPGVCAGKIEPKAYREIIDKLILFFEGKKAQLIKRLEEEMETAAANKHFEKAADLRDDIFALQHIRDVAVISKEDYALPLSDKNALAIDISGRLEAYDISNISGDSAVGSMVVFENKEPAKSEYRRFKIKTVDGADDVGMMAEVMERRVKRAKNDPDDWPLPELMIIDGGRGQVGKVKHILKTHDIDVPVIGIAKGFDRKQDRMVYDEHDAELQRIVKYGRNLFRRVRDEAHRFAVAYHKHVRKKKSFGEN